MENVSLAEARKALAGISGDLLEIEAELDVADAVKAGLVLRKDPQDREETLLYYDAVDHKLLKDTSKSRLQTQTQNPLMRPGGFVRRSTDQREELRNHFELKPGETLRMHVFIDKGLIQAYVNDRNTITTWAMPTLPASKGLDIFSEGDGVSVRSLKIRELSSIYY